MAGAAPSPSALHIPPAHTSHPPLVHVIFEFPDPSLPVSLGRSPLLMYLMPPTPRNFFSCKRKLAANVTCLRVLASANSLRDFESLFEGGRHRGQLIGRYAFVKSKGPRIPQMQLERDWMISSKSAPCQPHLIAQESPGFGEISSVDERCREI